MKRMRMVTGFHREVRGSQRLGHYLAAVQPSPWVTGARPHVSVRAVGGQVHHGLEAHLSLCRAQEFSRRGKTVCSTTSLMPAAIGIATRAPIIPRKAPPITTAKTVRTGDTFTAWRITRGTRT